MHPKVEVDDDEYCREKYSVSLEAWVEDCNKGFASFSVWWREQHKTDAKHFPLKLLPNEWDEQMERWGTAQECGVNEHR